MNKQNVIELNGKQYDALTGAYIGEANAAGSVAQTVVHQPVAIEKPAVVLAAVADRASKGHSPVHKAAHRPQQPKTLMRRVVKAPHQTNKLKSAIKSQTPLPATKASAVITPQTVVTESGDNRSQRSQEVSRSHMVKRFQPADAYDTSKLAAHPAIKKTYVNPSLKPKTLQQTQTIPPDVIAVSKPAHKHSVKQGTKHNPKQAPVASAAIPSAAALAALPPAPELPQASQAIAPSTPQLIRPQPLSLKHARRATIPVRQPFLPKNLPATAEANNEQNGQDIFEQALARANSHHQKPPKQSILRSALQRRAKNRQATNIAASAAVFLLLLGFITYQNKANIQMQMASAKAGFSVGHPGYKPDGFAMKKITYSSGTAAALYAKDERSFSIVQKKSNWDSQSLLENFVATSNKQYQGYEANGRTVYIYDDSKATWVNGGVWYQIDGGSVLSSEQLIKVAASM